MKPFDEQLNKLINKTKQDNDILAVFLFGSRVRDEDYSRSDIDICLVASSSLHTPSELFKKRLSYLKLFDMDIQIFQQLPIYIRMRIIKEGRLLFCRDEDKLYEITFNLIREFNDFEHIYRSYLEEVRNAG